MYYFSPGGEDKFVYLFDISLVFVKSIWGCVILYRMPLCVLIVQTCALRTSVCHPDPWSKTWNSQGFPVLQLAIPQLARLPRGRESFSRTGTSTTLVPFEGFYLDLRWPPSWLPHLLYSLAYKKWVKLITCGHQCSFRNINPRYCPGSWASFLQLAVKRII